MSISTSFKLLNSNDPKFIAARDGTPKEREEYESDNWGSIDDTPGHVLDIEEEDFIEETEEEYGGWIIDLGKLPKNVTHIKVFRS